MIEHICRRIWSALALAVALAAVGASPASAHITVNPSEARQGGFARLSFRVPNERDNSGTVKVEVEIPQSPPIPFVSVRPVPGWQYQVEKVTLAEPVESHGRTISTAVSKITWTGGPIKPGEFQEFDVSLGRLPKDVPELVFRAVQTYESGEVVRWIELPTPGGPEPEHPAPVLKLVEAKDDGHGAGTLAVQQTPAAASGEGDAQPSAALGIVALVLALVAVLLSGAALLMSLRKAATS